ncbi:aspartyl/asparaginyl beta-hydroxylase isoform X2 [Cylas formicarius]|uniref:aspartyl/asparaginyl beta-hydroxylase isoform X2 n=1 Tax=Cylas formicarius TaxID=197179 RepID=UPI0029583CB8|nr:aspartyl/asparaginyl beta-hydroxylase isoform X2 [Cylas formicarius]
MSGDVQPRKRKDKKKRKEDDPLFASNEDVNIHVHKEGGTGGGICAKIVFFLLFSALIVLVGLIIKENQGLNELENIDAESHYSRAFEGWLEEHSQNHDEVDDEQSPELVEDMHSDEDMEDLSEEPEDEASEGEEDETVEDDESDQQKYEDDTTENTTEDQTSESGEDVDDLEESGVNDEDKSEVTDVSAEQDTGSKEDADKNKSEETRRQEAESETITEEIHERREQPAPENPKNSLETPRSGTDEKEQTPSDLSRRNTIVPPPALEEIEADLNPEDGADYSEEDEELSEPESLHEHIKSPRQQYEDLRSTYGRALTPEGDFIAGRSEEEDNEEEEIVELEESDEVESPYDDDDDEELLKRLEAKYGKLGRDLEVDANLLSDAESASDKQSDDDIYEHSNITDKEDYLIRKDLDAAQEALKKNAAYANKLFEALLKKQPFSPRALYGKGAALDKLADQMRSNDMLQEALVYYLKVLNAPNVPDALYKTVAGRFIERARFLGQYKKAISVHWQLIERYPDEPVFRNNLAVTYLTINLVDDARTVLKKVLALWPNDGVALVHYGFILKTIDNKLEESVKYLTEGLKTRTPGVKDGRFYFHLGDALSRLGKQEDAMKLYEEGVEQGIFISKYQRSLYNVPRLKAQPWWEVNELISYKNLISTLKNNWKKIRNEGLATLNERGYFQDESENLRDTGTWKQLELFARGKKVAKNCAKCPVTCGIIQMFPEASGCLRGQTKFSVMHPNTHVWSHCGPTNCRLRIHLGLKVPPNTLLRVGEETRSWKEGDVIIFDDSFEHEVWHNGTQLRLVLIVDVWHPELSEAERKTLSPI